MSDAVAETLSKALEIYVPTELKWTGAQGETQILRSSGGGLVAAVEK